MAGLNLNSLKPEEFSKIINSFDTILTDCDGVLWFQNDPVENAANVMNAFLNSGKKIFYVTNNGTKTRDELVDKCKKLHFTATTDNILCTSYLTAKYLQDMNFKKKVYIIGSPAIAKELDKVGIQHTGVGPDPVVGPLNCELIKPDADIGAVVVGFDEHFSVIKMLKAATYLNDKNVKFIGTNTDERFPTSNKMIIPGTGSFVRCIETCSERKATIMGKPAPYVSSLLSTQYKIDPKRTLMIGDRANTDILLGKRCGFKTLMVLTGVNSIDDINTWKKSSSNDDKELIPDYYTSTIGDLLPHISIKK
ncbi:hypothetical protein HCN44_009429 [Aphidius gifuensis]|uniref:Phosphoglycolate phosphatase n=1 Tax=Aphidius gifuensis TaxID=684658 RepID=A0A834Y4P2_APHGI|nr:glycerol-3-phosphate phosphatase [Aphidius gifuensis]KAF7998031.1 hypothetical protein HCN44_009429 [Aphidius gifuensis]